MRATSNGISALISPRGEIVARRDHTVEGPGAAVLTGELPLGDGFVTVYGRLGDWPMLVLSVGLLGAAFRRRLIACLEAP